MTHHTPHTRANYPTIYLILLIPLVYTVMCEHITKSNYRIITSVQAEVACMERPSSLSREAKANSTPMNTVSSVEHYTCALVGLVAVASLTPDFIPLLSRLTQQFGEFSTTILVFVLTTLWVLVWISLESLWEWRAGRLSF